MKKLLLVAIVTMLSCSSFAQWSIGGSVGAVYSHPFLHQNKYNFYHYRGNWGPAIDFTWNYQFNDRWGIISGLSFQQKGYKSYTKASYSIIRYNDFYISVPMMAVYSFAKGEKGSFFVDAGAYIAYGCGSNRSYSVLDGGSPSHYYNVIEPFDYDFKSKRFEFGLIGGVGYKYYFCSRWTSFAEVRYQHALISHFKENQTLDFLIHNNAIVFQLGLLYNLKK